MGTGANNPFAQRSGRCGARPLAPWTGGHEAAAAAAAGRPTRPPACRAALTATALVALLSALGCAPYRALALPERPAHSLANRQEQKGLVVAARVYLESGALPRYFATEVWAEGFLPVIVHLENRGENSVEIQRKDLVVWLETSGSDSRLEPQSPGEVIRRCRSSAATAYFLAPLLVVPALWAHRSIEDYNFDLAADIEAKALPGYLRLEPGDPLLAGAVFFRRPQGEKPLEELMTGAELRMVVNVEGSRVPTAAPVASGPAGDGATRVGESITFYLPLGGEEE